MSPIKWIYLLIIEINVESYGETNFTQVYKYTYINMYNQNGVGD